MSVAPATAAEPARASGLVLPHGDSSVVLANIDGRTIVRWTDGTKITVCDQWQFVRDNAGGVYTEWWKGKNVHFGGKGSDELGRLIARHVLKALGERSK